MLNGGCHENKCLKCSPKKKKKIFCNFFLPPPASNALMIWEHHEKSVDHSEMHCGCNGGFVLREGTFKAD